MSDRTLLASVALFRELYDNQKDVYDVISELIKASLVFSKAHLTDATHAAGLIRQHFEMSLPEAVVSTALKQRLCKRDHVVSKISHGYLVDGPGLAHMGQHIIDDFAVLRESQEAFIKGLKGYIESRRDKHLSGDEEGRLVAAVCDYFFEGKRKSEYDVEISGYIIHNKGDAGFTGRLNAVREGFVLYDGVRHSPDPSKIGSWGAPLVVYLDTENLFSAVGLNGELHRQLVREFLSLASDVKVQGARAIHVRYFTECFDEVDRFFYAAEAIVDGRGQLDPSKPAMVSIVEGCSRKSDVLEKKAKFFSDLEKMGITQCDLSIDDVDPNFNIDSEGLQRSIESDLGSSDREYNEEKCSNLLQMFTKVNFLRYGKNAGPFESVGHVLLCESFLAKYLSYHDGIFINHGNITYSVDLEFITNRIWFKLNKGLGKEFAHPQSLSVLAKAQVVLASQVNNSISSQYDELNKRRKDGELDNAQAAHLLDSLRRKLRAPEGIDEGNVELVVDFISKSDLENARREQQLLLLRVGEGEKAIATLEAIEAKRSDRKLRMAKWISLGACALIISLIAYGLTRILIFLLRWLSSAEDTRLAGVCFILAVIGIILAIVNIKMLVKSVKWLQKTLFLRIANKE